MIKHMNLSGTWAFALDPDKDGITRGLFQEDLADTIALPGTTSMAGKGPLNEARETGFLTDLHKYEGYAWYSRQISLQPEDLERQIVLYLERTRMTKVWVNDRLVGDGDSLNTPHQYDLTPYIHQTDFRLTILVSNVDYPTGGGHLTSPDTQTNWNGIIGEIALHLYDEVSIRDIKVFTDIDTRTARLVLTTDNRTGSDVTRPVRFRAELTDIHGTTGRFAPEHTEQITFPAGTSTQTVTYSLGEDAVLWSEYSPVIYTLTASLPDGESTQTTFGLRRFATEGMDFTINGTKTFLRGKHDGLIFPLTGACPTTVQEWLRVLGISRSYGINHYRFHTCCPPDAAFTAADLLGIYMEPQLPFWGTITTPDDENHNEAEQQYLI